LKAAVQADDAIPNLDVVTANYTALREQMGLSDDKVQAEIAALTENAKKSAK
jgi:hypothetical protein